MMPIAVIQNNRQIASLMKRRRKALGITQTDLANRIGLAQSGVTEMEKQRRAYIPQRTLKMLRELGLELHITEMDPRS